jgi:hypothetical protein
MPHRERQRKGPTLPRKSVTAFVYPSAPKKPAAFRAAQQNACHQLNCAADSCRIRFSKLYLHKIGGQRSVP